MLRTAIGGLVLLSSTTHAWAQPIEASAKSIGGQATHAISWVDASGAPRTVYVLDDNHRIVRYEYEIDGDGVIDEAVGGYGIGNFVHHGDCAAGGVASLEGVSEYAAEEVLAGPHHYIWRSTFRFFMCDHPDTAWRVTNEYVFVTGEDHFIQTAAYDSSDLPETEPIGEDMRGPYNQTTWPGSGSISGFGWGSEYRFRTVGSIAEGDANVGGDVSVSWDWTEPNTIPYVWEWAHPDQGGAVDREYGVVQNQPYREQDFGGGFYGCGGDCFASAPPLTGESMPAAWAVPTQLNSYDSNYRSGRITWGQTYGTFENGHSNDTGTIPDMGDHFRPVNAWSWTHVVGKHSAEGVSARVRDTENAYASKLTSSVGSVLTSGPRGPGNFVGPSLGEMPSITWSNPGFDFIYRTWNITADQGNVAATLDVSDSLTRPVFVIHEFPAGDHFVSVDGEPLTADGDYYASYDQTQARLWITLDRTLEEGSHTISVSSSAPNSQDGSGGASGMTESSGSDSGKPIPTTTGDTQATTGAGGSGAPEPGPTTTGSTTAGASGTTTSAATGGAVAPPTQAAGDSGCSIGAARAIPSDPLALLGIGVLLVGVCGRRRRAEE